MPGLDTHVQMNVENVVREFQTASDGDGERLPAGGGGAGEGMGEVEKLCEGEGASAGQMEMK